MSSAIDTYPVSTLTKDKQELLEQILSWSEEEQKNVIKVIEKETKIKLSEIKDFDERLKKLSEAIEKNDIDLSVRSKKRYPENISMI